MGLFDNAPITVECPKCGRRFNERLRRLKKDPDLTCPGCGNTITVHAGDLRRGLKGTDESIDKLRRTIRKLDKG